MGRRDLWVGLAIVSAWFVIESFDASGMAQSRQQGVPVTITGEFEVIHIDDLRGRSEHRYFVRDEASGEAFELRFEGPAPRHLRTGRRITVRGDAHDNRISVRELAAEGEPGDETGDAAASAVTEHKAVVMLANFIDASVAASAATATSYMFTGSNSVANNIEQSSYGQASVPADTDGDGQPDVFGPYDIPYSSNSCDYYAWASAADSAATAAGVNLSLYQHRVYVLPSACGWGGVANLGCGSYCRAWIFSSTNGPVYTHEFGHNLSMHHASTDPENDGNINSEYGDLSDPEGSTGGGWRGYNAAHRYQMDWLDPASAPTVVSSGIYDIYPLALDPLLAGGPQTLVISKPDTNELYFVSYRRPIGVDAGISSSYIGGASIHRYHGSSAVQTKFIKVLADGGTFEDPINGITVTQLSRAPDNSYVTVAVDYDCASSNPTVDISPSSVAVGPDEGSTHTVSVTNNDGPSCAGTTFDLVATYGPGISGQLSVSQLTLSPGGMGTATLQLTASAADGTYTATVEAIDLDGLEPDHNIDVSATVTVSVDAVAPTAPTNLTSSLAGQGNQVQLIWDPASDSGSGLDYYAVYRDGGSGLVEVGQTSGESYTDNSVGWEVTYT